jgi:TonB-linked SusC/RagA family outer membrane protein
MRSLLGRVVLQLRFSIAAAFGLLAPAVAAGQQATLSGRVTAAGTGQPIAEVRVYVVASNAVASTNVDGRYQLRVSPGVLEVRAIRIGYQEQKRTVNVPAGGTATLDFSMAPSLIKLTEIVTTAVGEQRKVELGNSVQTLGDVALKVEQAPVTNLSDLMVAKAPGVQVLAGNMTGSAPTVRIRGIKSLSLNSEPIYVIDGVRMNSASINIGTASVGNGTTASYLNALDPEEIADIEIVKGPSAATLYGTDAANGVIVITTKRGAAGPARWTVHAGTGLVQDRNNYPTQYAIFGHAPATPTTPLRCVLVTIASGACVADSTTSFNLLQEPGFTPITNGYTKQSGVQVSGGTDIVRYFVSGDYEGEQGPLQIPAFGQRFLDSTGTQMRDEWLHPEAFARKSLRANLSATLSPTLDLNVNTGYIGSDQRLPPVDNNTFSYLYNAFQNPGFKPTVACQAAPASCLGYSDKGSVLGEELGGYGFFTPANLFQRQLNLGIDRFITTATANWRPLAWMTNDATLGMDMAQRDILQLCRFNECPASGITRLGSVSDTRTVDRNISAKLVSSGSWQARPTVNLRTTLGADYVNQGTAFSQGGGNQLPPGAQSAGQAAVQFATSSPMRATKTLGYYAQEQVSIRDLLFITGALRTDQNSAFGTNFQRVVYPKASVSYIVSDESFFPKFNWLNQLRLRGAYGASGVQPGSTTALQTYAASTVNLGTAISTTGTDTPGLVADSLGNADLRPERSTERELGFETRLFDSRVNFDFTYYNNVTKDALIAQPIAASAGASALSVLRNLGSVRNTGIEATITATIMDRRNFGWDITVGGSHNNNKIESLGFQSCTVNTTDCLTGTKPNPTIGTGANRDSVGYPIRGVYARLYHFNDANGNGIIEPSEVTVDSNFTFLGYAVPRDLVTVQNGFDLFNKLLRVNVLLDYKGGFSLFNNSSSFYCQQANTCYDETHVNASLDDQARLIALRYKTPSTSAGYWENGQFWRLREVGATINVPTSLANRMRARDASLTFSARNLHVWTAYKGTDPESNYSTGNVQTDFSTTAPPSYFTLRLNLHY